MLSGQGQKNRMALVYLVADTRERHVHASLQAIFGPAGAEVHIGQINVGDYLICRRKRPGEAGAPEILACIERKTLKDFAASFKDGRYQNRQKMLDLRSATGCQLYFFVEGPAFPKPTWKVARIPYESILAAMTSLMVRDGVHVVQTKDELGSARRLLRFVRAFEKRASAPPRPEPGERALLLGGGGQARRGPGGPIPAIATGRIQKSDAVLAAEMWSKLAGVSIPTAQTLMRAFSVADWVGGRAPPGALAALRTAGGRPLGRRAVGSLQALRSGQLKALRQILAGVPGISPGLADQILAAYAPAGPNPLAALLAGSRSEVAAVAILQKGHSKRLGPARAERLWRLLHYSSGGSPLPEGAEGSEEPAPPGAEEPGPPGTEEDGQITSPAGGAGGGPLEDFLTALFS
jgi:hypothetical protein